MSDEFIGGSPAILGGAATRGTAPFRARDVRANIKELGFEKGMEMSLTLMADEQVGIRQAISNLAEMQQQMITLLEQMTTVNGAIAQKMDTMKREEDQHDENRGHGIIPSRN